MVTARGKTPETMKGYFPCQVQLGDIQLHVCLLLPGSVRTAVRMMAKHQRLPSGAHDRARRPVCTIELQSLEGPAELLVARHQQPFEERRQRSVKHLGCFEQSCLSHSAGVHTEAEACDAADNATGHGANGAHQCSHESTGLCPNSSAADSSTNNGEISNKPKALLDWLHQASRSFLDVVLSRILNEEQVGVVCARHLPRR
mmetsp:Transcript_88293/g.274435  ORF Transcript_88293/g.274435 Transcript_88293/m.274435 type:complete len:201 (-) Transcript_88293:122-724(-)